MKKLWKTFCAGVLTLAVGAAALAPAALALQLPSLPQDQCVVDEAGVLSEETAQYLDTLNGQLEASCAGAQIGVVTVEYTGSATTEEYALEVFNTWGIGSAEENNGVLLLLVMNSPLYADGDYYLTYGDGFRNTTLEKQASALAQTMEADFAAKDYDGAVKTCADAVAGTITQIYGTTLEGGQAQPGGGMGVLDWISMGISLILTLFVFLFLFFALFRAVIWPIGYHGFGWHWGPFGWFVPRGPRPPRGPRGPRPPRGPHNPPPPGGFGGFGGHSGFGGGGFGGGGFGGMGGGSSHGGGGGRGR